MEEKETGLTEEQIKELMSKIQEGILQKEKEGKKDKSIKVDMKSELTMNELFVRITKNPEQDKFYLSISPKGGHPVYNKVIFDSSDKLKKFVNALKTFIKEREDILIAIDRLNKNIQKKEKDVV
jgi:hypothetical protein